jgi:hypothetical protein
MIAEMSKEHFNAMLNRFSYLKAKFRESTKIYKDPWKRYITSLLRKVPYLNDFLAKATLKELVYYLKVQKYDANNWINRPGEHAESVQFVGEGEIEISICINDAQISEMLNAGTKKVGRGLKRRATLVEEGMQDKFVFDITCMDRLKKKAEMIPIMMNNLVVGYAEGNAAVSGGK